MKIIIQFLRLRRLRFDHNHLQRNPRHAAEPDFQGDKCFEANLVSGSGDKYFEANLV